MKLLLTFNGITSPELEKAFAEMTDGRTDLRVAVIPTAGDPIEWIPDPMDAKKFTAKLTGQSDLEKNQQYLDYQKKGYDVIIVDLKHNPEVVREKLENVDIIDVGGGDVNYLLDWARKSKLDMYLKDLLLTGAVYVGASAGSMLLLPDIGLTWYEPGDQSDHVGIGIVDFLITPHKKEAELETNVIDLVKRREHLQSIMNYPWKIYLLQDGQAVQVVGEKIEHIGPGKKRSI